MKPAVILVAYALLLLALGAYAFFSAPPGANAKTALIVTGGCALLILIAAVLLSRGGGSPTLARVGGIAGLVLPILYTLVFASRAWKTIDPAKLYLRNILWILAAVSVAAFVAMLVVRRQSGPPPAP